MARRKSPRAPKPIVQLQHVVLWPTRVPGRVRLKVPALRGAADGLPPAPPGAPDSIIGDDDRQAVGDTRRMPYRVICLLDLMFSKNRRRIGSGVLIGPRSVATAAHNVYNRALGGPVVRIRVTPAAYLKDGVIQAPYGQTTITAAECHVRQEYRDHSDSGSDERTRFDYAVLQLPTDISWGTLLGTMALTPIDGQFNADWFARTWLYNSGYPAGQTISKPLGMQVWHVGHGWADGVSYIDYTIDTEGGQSGSPIFFIYDTSPDGTPLCCVAAIHTKGFDASNSGVRVVNEAYKDLVAWRV